MADEGLKGVIQDVRDELFLDGATGKYLDTIGQNHGYERPRAWMGDETWRRVLRLVMMAPKTVQERFERLLDVLVGGWISIVFAGDVLTHPPDLRVEAVLAPPAPPGAAVAPEPPAVEIRLTGAGLPAPVSVTAAGAQVGTPGSPVGADVVVERALGGQTEARLRFTPVQPATVELWVNPHTDAAPLPVPLAAPHFTAAPDGTVTFDVLPAPLTFFAVDPMTGAPVPRPGLPAGAEVLAVYQIDTRTYAGLASALRSRLPPDYHVAIDEASEDRLWTDLQALAAGMVAELYPPAPGDGSAPTFARLVSRIDLRSWSVYDAGVAAGPSDDQPTTPFLDQDTVGPRVFVDLGRRPDVTRQTARLPMASYLLDDFPPPRPHPGGYPGPYVYTYDDRQQVYGREITPGAPATWEPFATEFGAVVVVNPATGLPETVTVRLDRHATDPFTGGPLATAILPATVASPAQPVAPAQLFKDFARARPFSPRPDRSDHPLVLFADELWLERLMLMFDLVRAAGVFVTFERAVATTVTTAPPWFVDSSPLDPTP